MLAARATRAPVSRVVLAFAIGIVTHIALDAIPHADYGNMSRRAMAPVILAEAITVATLSLAILWRRMPAGAWLAIGAGLIGATLPDIRFGADLGLPHAQALAVTRAAYWFHSWFHADPVSLKIGMTTQVTASVLLVASLAFFPRVAAGKEPD